MVPSPPSDAQIIDGYRSWLEQKFPDSLGPRLRAAPGPAGRIPVDRRDGAEIIDLYSYGLDQQLCSVQRTGASIAVPSGSNVDTRTGGRFGSSLAFELTRMRPWRTSGFGYERTF